MIDKITRVFETLKRAFSYFFDSRIPLSYKIIPLLALVYLIYPFDFISDFIPFFGQADDLTILSLAIAFFVDLADKKLKV